MSAYHKLQSETSEESADGVQPPTTSVPLTQAQRPRSVSIHNTLIVTPPLSPGSNRNWNPNIEACSNSYHNTPTANRRSSLGPNRSKSPSQLSPQDDLTKKMGEGMNLSRSPNRTSPNLSRSPTRTPVRRRRQRPSSPHHNRSQSVKTYSRTPKLESAFRSRLGSVPTENLLFPGRYGPHFDPEMDDEYYYLRSFVVTSNGGVINRGDSLRRRAHSYNSIASEKSYPSSCTVGSSDCDSSGLVEGDIDPLPKVYKVLILGQTGVGKTALITQFLSSEYMNAYDASLEESVNPPVENEKRVFGYLDDYIFLMSPLPSLCSDCKNGSAGISPEILESTAEGPAASLDNSTLYEDGDTTATERTFFIEKKYDKHEAMLFKLQVFQRQDEMRWEKEEETKRKY
ncbi:hypothetical protein GQR58_013157 [Nymphon striatum]|nr:hypothetical protein GQR58_013157 [Nymphon striatum]